MRNIGWRVLWAELAMLALICLAVGFAGAEDIGDDDHAERMIPGQPSCVGYPRACHPQGVPVDVLQSGRGFALKDNQSHVLRLNVENLLPLEPMFVRNLMSSNKTLEQIREEIENRGGEMVQRGSMRLDQSIYSLINIELIPSDNNTMMLQADVADPVQSLDLNNTAAVGSISATISTLNGEAVGKGWLVMNYGEHAGRYDVLLDMQPPMHEAGMMMPRR